MTWLNYLSVNIVSLDPTYVYFTVFLIAATSIVIYLVVRSSDDFSVEETEKISEDFAGEIRDSNGPVTKWLWVVYAGLIIWALAYLVQHWSEFVVFP